MRDEHAIWFFSDAAYLHWSGGAWLQRRPLWAGRGMEMPPQAQAVLAEFEGRSAAFNNGRPMPLLLDDAAALGPGTAHTSRVRFVSGPGGPDGKALVVYLRPASRSDLYAVLHEVAHNLLYAEGLARLMAPPFARPDTLALISQISTSTSHPLAMQRLEEFDFHVFRYEAARGERFLRLVARGAPGLVADQVAILAAEFAAALGHFWMAGAQPALRRLGNGVAERAEELRAPLERCFLGVAEAERARAEILDMLLYGVETRIANPLEEVAGPGAGAAAWAEAAG